MATLDIFNDDAFSVSNLTRTIVDLPRVPTRIGELGLFEEGGISTTSMMIERDGQSLKLVPAATRGSSGEPVTLKPRSLISVNAVHLPQRGSVLADEVQGVRAFGSETEVEAVQAVVNKKLAKMKAQLDLTLEYQRIGAIKGKVMDADGTTQLLDVYDAFGMTQASQNFALSTATTAVRSKLIALRRAVQAALGGLSYQRVHVFCSETFFDSLIAHASVAKAFELYQQNSLARDQQGTTFEMGGVVFEEYIGGVGAMDFIPAGEAYAFPLGVPGLFTTDFAPADYMETVNTTGLPYYAKQEMMRMNKGVELESQSNPITLCTRPESVIKLTAS
ncbi:MAG: hypothetical protein RIS35_3751 [Pseudomonadota bacterium]|jgi:hypothetical protein